jgi:hypothetical protein
MIKQLEIEQPKLTEEQEEQQYWDSLKFNSHKWIEHTKGYYSCEFCNTNHTSVMPVNGHTLCSKNPHILNQKNSNYQEVTSDTPSNYQRGWNAAQRGLLQNDAWGDTYTDNANNRPSHEELDEWIKGWKAYRHSNEIAKN